MENTVFERNYEIVEKDDRATAVFERAFAPGGRVYKENGRNPEGGCAEG